MAASPLYTLFTLLLVFFPSNNEAAESLLDSQFDSALETLQNKIGYNFKRINLLRRAMTHASFSEENYKALSTLGSSVIGSSASLLYLQKDIDMSSKVLSRRLLELSNSCVDDGLRRLRLHQVIRVSPKTNSSAPAVVCGAFRALFGAIAVDSGKSDQAGSIFWIVHEKDVIQANSL